MATNTGNNTTNTIPITSSFVEGQSTVRPPLFNGSNYAYWACRMKIYLQSISLDTWNMTQTEYVEPTIDFAQWTTEQKTVAQHNSKAMNILFCSLDRNEFNRVSVCKSAFEIWRTLQVTHEGTSKVKQTKISILTNQFQMFKMHENESVSDMYCRFQDIVHSLIALGKGFSEEDQVRKILNSLTPEWDQKTLTIEEANDVSQMKIEELIGNLMSYEVQLQSRRESKATEKKSIAFKATTGDSEPESDEEIAYMTRNFKKFLKYRKMNNFKRNDQRNFRNSSDYNNDNNNNNNNGDRCYNCNKPGHYKMNCPYPDKQTLQQNNEHSKKRKKAYAATLDDSDSSSDDEKKPDNSNLCFTAILESEDDRSLDLKIGTHLF